MASMLFQIAVCDDENSDRDKLIQMTEAVCREEGIAAQIKGFSGAQALTEALFGGEQFDLLLLDVLMPEKTGLELARRIREKSIMSQIVFVSSSRELAMYGYEVAAARYLGKPVEEERLREALLYCYAKRREDAELMLPVKGGVRKAYIKDICFAEIIGRRVRVSEMQEEWESLLTMSELEELLGSGCFIRCHQSFLVNCAHIRSLQTAYLELDNGKSIPVSKHRLKETREAFFAYMKR